VTLGAVAAHRAGAIASMDINGDGRISFSEFAQMWTTHARSSFNKVDVSREGTLTFEELERLLPPSTTVTQACATLASLAPDLFDVCTTWTPLDCSLH
jgi:hypothetical protein